MNIFKATSNYENWLRDELNVVEDDLALKHTKMAENPSSFLRATFYRWMQVWPEVCKEDTSAPVVLSVGDLHAANFGTWRDAESHLVWGINDFDEVYPLPYTLDLTRLATSVQLASETGELKINIFEGCEAILDGYRDSLESGGRPFALNGDHEWLRKAYVLSDTSAEKFWEKLDQLPDLLNDLPPNARAVLETALPATSLEYWIKHRQAGIGSLGRPRYTALATWQDERVAREVKPLLPSAAAWANEKYKRADIFYETILAQAVRATDPVVKVQNGWIVRRLAPDSRRIELSELGRERDEARMMHAMGWETANIHLGTSIAIKSILKDLKERKKSWLTQSAQVMAGATRNDWEAWKAD
jgi:uncharacterized protein (DUF2252 family)